MFKHWKSKGMGIRTPRRKNSYHWNDLSYSSKHARANNWSLPYRFNDLSYHSKHARVEIWDFSVSFERWMKNKIDHSNASRKLYWAFERCTEGMDGHSNAKSKTEKFPKLIRTRIWKGLYIFLYIFWIRT